MTHTPVKPRQRLLAAFPHVFSTISSLSDVTRTSQSGTSTDEIPPPPPPPSRARMLRGDREVYSQTDRPKAMLISQKLAHNGEKHPLSRRPLERSRGRVPFITNTSRCKSKHTVYILQIWLNLHTAPVPVNLMYRRGSAGLTSNPRPALSGSVFGKIA